MNRAVTLTLPHELGRAEARRRIDKGFDGFARRMGAAAGALNRSWSGDRLSFIFQAFGQGISGTVDVEDSVVRLELLLPGLLAVMAEAVKARLRRESRLLLDKT